MPVIVLAALKGGVGKSTGCMGLAAAALADGRQSYVIDTDEQGGSIDWAEFATARGRQCPEVRPAEAIDEDHDPDAWVFVDTPPSPGLNRLTRRALDVADLVVMPITSSRGDMMRLAVTAEVVALHTAAPAVVLLNRVRASTRSPEQVATALRSSGHRVLSARVPMREAIAQALGTTPPPVMVDAYRPVLTELDTVLQEVPA